LFSDIGPWMNLILNDNKTNIIYLASPQCVKSVKTPVLHMGASSITSNDSVKHLRVIFDNCINMYEHVTSVCWAAYYQLKNIYRLKAFLTQEAVVTEVHALVSDINLLQRIQNSASRIVTNTRKSMITHTHSLSLYPAPSLPTP